MPTAANPDYQNSAWQSQPWGNSGQYAPNGATPNGAGPNGPVPYWHGPHLWHPYGISRPLGIAATVLGFIFWWPIGLALLIFMTASGRAGCRARRAWMQQNQSGAPSSCAPWSQWKAQWPTWGGLGGALGGGGGGNQQPPSSGNHAFDDYRTETLRRLEEEQKDFTAFLDRLRFAKDKAEFDQFMSERRQAPRPPAMPDEPSHG